MGKIFAAKNLRVKPEMGKIFAAKNLGVKMDVNEEIAQALEADDDDGGAALAHLAAGRPITYRDAEYPEELMRRWPDGRREFIALDAEFNVFVVWELTPRQ